MKRVSKAGLMLVSLLALTCTASAEPNYGNNTGGGQQFSGRNYEQWQSKRELYQKLAKKFHKPKPIPIDPGRGDGSTPDNPKPQTPQGPPGFIWVNGHWERERAPVSTPNVPQNPTVVVRDHRTPWPGTVVVRDHRTPGPGSVIVRDHRTPRPGTVVIRDHRTDTPGTVVVRDHRTVTPNGGWQVRPAGPQDVSSSPGGVTVTDSPRVHVRDHRR